MATQFKLPQRVNKSDQARLAKERACNHDLWWTRCSRCAKILGSDSQINVDTEEDLQNHNHAYKYSAPVVTKTSYAVQVINLEKDQETIQEVAGYIQEEIVILKGSAKVIYSEPFKEISKQINLTTGDRLRLMKNQTYQIKTVKNAVALTITKINI